MVGYDRQSTGYLVYFPDEKRVYVRRDVWFDEKWRFCVVDKNGLPQPTYKNPVLTDCPMPPGELISGGVVRVPVSEPNVPTVQATAVPNDGELVTIVDNAPHAVPTPHMQAERAARRHRDALGKLEDF